ncbi:MAG: anaerobic ribonucleoside-triphosphate reductase [Candidatus Obscuribacterales bacterium]|nr:anaerobic ribonucleoside-triphosphate reductase [Candidatus Obscuribacterales bacterium]
MNCNLKEEERQRCEVWTRVMGYHRPVSSFNLGKKSEHKERKHFTEEQSGGTLNCSVDAN